MYELAPKISFDMKNAKSKIRCQTYLCGVKCELFGTFWTKTYNPAVPSPLTHSALTHWPVALIISSITTTTLGGAFRHFETVVQLLSGGLSPVLVL